MTRLAWTLALASLAFAGTAKAATYSCSAEAPQMLVEDGEAVRLQAIGLPSAALESRAFTIQLTPRSDSSVQEAKVTWPGDPFQMAGNFQAIPTGEGAWSIVTISGGPCMFTDTACTNNIQIIDQSATSAEVLILPSAFSTDVQRKTRMPFIGLIRGHCSKAAKP